MCLSFANVLSSRALKSTNYSRRIGSNTQQGGVKPENPVIILKCQSPSMFLIRDVCVQDPLYLMHVRK